MYKCTCRSNGQCIECNIDTTEQHNNTNEMEITSKGLHLII